MVSALIIQRYKEPKEAAIPSNRREQWGSQAGFSVMEDISYMVKGILNHCTFLNYLLRKVQEHLLRANVSCLENLDAVKKNDLDTENKVKG